MAVLAPITMFALAEKKVATEENECGGLHLKLNNFAAATLRILVFGLGCPFVVATTVTITPAVVIVCNGFVCGLLP